MLTNGLSDIDIVIQLALLMLLFYGYVRYKVRHRFKGHGIIFAVATTLNMVAILFLMLPNLDSKLSERLTLDSDSLLVLVHSVVGGTAAVLAVYIVARWFWYGRKARSCRGKSLMNFTLVTWMASLSLGIYQYFLG